MTNIRVIAALVMAPLAILAILLLSTPWMAALAAAIVLLGLWEWFRLAGIDDTLPRTVLLLLNLLLMVLLTWASRSSGGFSPALFQIVVLAGVAWWLVALVWLRFFGFASSDQTYGRVFKLAAGTLATVPAWAALCLLHSGNFVDFDDSRQHRWLLTALAVVWAADTGAYFAGRHLGKRKLAPRISPNKTVAGLVGGVVAGVAAGIGFGLLAGVQAPQIPALMLAAAAAVLFSVIGDLFESLLKRHVGAKDSGKLIPGHGGILDRVDGVLAALPAFVLAKELLGF